MVDCAKLGIQGNVSLLKSNVLILNNSPNLFLVRLTFLTLFWKAMSSQSCCGNPTLHKLCMILLDESKCFKLAGNYTLRIDLISFGSNTKFSIESGNLNFSIDIPILQDHKSSTFNFGKRDEKFKTKTLQLIPLFQLRFKYSNCK